MSILGRVLAWDGRGLTEHAWSDVYACPDVPFLVEDFPR